MQAIHKANGFKLNLTLQLARVITQQVCFLKYSKGERKIKQLIKRLILHIHIVKLNMAELCISYSLLCM